MNRIPGVTSTGSKRPDALFGPGDPSGLPGRLMRAEGCRVWDDQGRTYLDCIMALGAVALGYGHPDVNRAAIGGITAGVVGPLAPELEEMLAEELADAIPWIEQVIFLKTGAEAVAAAVRIARVHTARTMVLGCGYHGWLDWCSQGAGVPDGTMAALGVLEFDNIEDLRKQVRRHGDKLAAIVIEPVIDRLPSMEWLTALREETAGVGAVLVFDEIKTGCRLAIGGAAERFGVHPDLMVLGKAIGNGFPIAAVGGSREVMMAARRTWISSTLATEMPSLAAALATIRFMRREGVPRRLGEAGARLMAGLESLAKKYPTVAPGVAGIPEMCHLRFRSEDASFKAARECAKRGVLFKRSAYNFVSLAHGPGEIDAVLSTLDEVLGGMV